MRGYSSSDEQDTDMERQVEFVLFGDRFDEDYLIPKIFRQFEKDFNENPNRKYLQSRYDLSLYMLNKLIRICQKRKRVGLNLI